MAAFRRGNGHVPPAGVVRPPHAVYQPPPLQSMPRASSARHHRSGSSSKAGTWYEWFDDASGAFYYQNLETNQVTWERPQTGFIKKKHSQKPKVWYEWYDEKQRSFYYQEQGTNVVVWDKPTSGIIHKKHNIDVTGQRSRRPQSSAPQSYPQFFGNAPPPQSVAPHDTSNKVWYEWYDSALNRVYYQDAATNTVVWDRPLSGVIQRKHGMGTSPAPGPDGRGAMYGVPPARPMTAPPGVFSSTTPPSSGPFPGQPLSPVFKSGLAPPGMVKRFTPPRGPPTAIPAPVVSAVEPPPVEPPNDHAADDNERLTSDSLLKISRKSSRTAKSKEKEKEKKAKKKSKSKREMPLWRSRASYANVNINMDPAAADPENFKLQWGNIKNYSVNYSDVMGAGAFGEVVTGVDRRTGKKLAMKIIKPEKMKEVRVQQEVMILQLVKDGPNIIELIDLVEDPKRDLKMLVFERVVNMKAKDLFLTMSDQDAKGYLYQILNALLYAHRMGIIHRDVKTGNILYEERHKRAVLIDWGFGIHYNPLVPIPRFPGTKSWKAPELFLRYDHYDFAVDMWAFGLLVGQVILGRSMFVRKGDTNQDQFDAIVKILGTKDLITYINKYKIPPRNKDIDLTMFFNMPPTRRREFSLSVKNKNIRDIDLGIDIMEKLLVYDHEKRMTAEECIEHPYFDSVRNIVDSSSSDSVTRSS